MSAPFRFPKFFVTNPSPCPYLPGKVERKVFTELNGRHASELNEALGRIARLHVAAHDQPGALAAITAKVYEAGVNVIEINHSRIFTRLPAKDTMIEVECEARDPQSIDDVVARLEAAGFRVERASLD